MRKSITLFSLLALAAAALAVAGQPGPAVTPRRPRPSGTATDPTFPPMESTTTAGKPVGFDIDMAAALAKTDGRHGEVRARRRSRA